jgi:hypothetical protein
LWRTIGSSPQPVEAKAFESDMSPTVVVLGAEGEAMPLDEALRYACRDWIDG